MTVLSWNRILVPHDFSPCADRALAEAVAVARRQHARLVLFHVTHLPPGLGPETLISHEETGELVPVGSFARKGARYRLEEVAGPLRAQGLTVATRAAIGDTAEEILAVAKSEAIDLIVMGTHGRHGLRHILLGSIAEKIIRQATVPVLTVRSEGEATPTAEELRLADEGAG